MAGADNIAVEVQTTADTYLPRSAFRHHLVSRKLLSPFTMRIAMELLLEIRVRPDRADYGETRIPKLIALTSGCRVADGIPGSQNVDRILKGCIRFGSVHIIRAEYCIDLRGVQHTDLVLLKWSAS